MVQFDNASKKKKLLQRRVERTRPPPIGLQTIPEDLDYRHFNEATIRASTYDARMAELHRLRDAFRKWSRPEVGGATVLEEQNARPLIEDVLEEQDAAAINESTAEFQSPLEECSASPLRLLASSQAQRFPRSCRWDLNSPLF